MVNEAATACRSGLMGMTSVIVRRLPILSVSLLCASLQLRTSVTPRQPLAVAGRRHRADSGRPDGRAVAPTTGPSGAAAQAGRPLRRDRPARQVDAAVGQAAGRRRPGLARPDRQPLDAGRLRQPHLPATPRPATSRTGRSAWSRSTRPRGKTIWEKLFPVYLTDIPAHRVAWASPSVDPGDRQRLHLRRQRPPARLRAGRQAAVGALAGRGVRRRHDARRPRRRRR